MNKDVNDELSCCPVFKEMVDAFYAPCPTIENMRHQAERVSVLSKNVAAASTLVSPVQQVAVDRGVLLVHDDLAVRKTTRVMLEIITNLK